jgi:hypothetical protein
MVLQISSCLGFRLQASYNGLANYSYLVLSIRYSHRPRDAQESLVFFCARRIEANKNLEARARALVLQRVRAVWDLPLGVIQCCRPCRVDGAGCRHRRGRRASRRHRCSSVSPRASTMRHLLWGSYGPAEGGELGR